MQKTINSSIYSKILIFDGICNFCNFWVRFIIEHDKKAKIKFVPSQSPIANDILFEYDSNKLKMDYVIFIDNDKIYKKSDAIFQVLSNLSGFWRHIVVFKIIPAVIRDFFYDIIAKCRYQIFGKKDKCIIPDDNLKNRFLI